MSTPDAPAIDYAYWREQIAKAEARSGLAVLRYVDRVSPELLRVLLDAHEREASKEPVAWMVEPVGGLSTFAVVGPPEVARSVSDAGDRLTPLGPCGPTTTDEPEEG